MRWMAGSLLAAMALAMGPVLCSIGSVERYLADGAPCMMLLSAIGAWKILEWKPARPKMASIARIGAVVFCYLNVLFSILLVLSP